MMRVKLSWRFFNTRAIRRAAHVSVFYSSRADVTVHSVIFARVSGGVTRGESGARVGGKNRGKIGGERTRPNCRGRPHRVHAPDGGLLRVSNGTWQGMPLPSDNRLTRST